MFLMCLIPKFIHVVSIKPFFLGKCLNLCKDLPTILLVGEFIFSYFMFFISKA